MHGAAVALLPGECGQGVGWHGRGEPCGQDRPVDDAPPPPRAGQEHLPWLTPRPTLQLALEVLITGDGERLHLDEACPWTSRSRLASGGTVTLGRAVAAGAEHVEGFGMPLCHTCAGPLESLAGAVGSDDRRVALVGLTGHWMRLEQGRLLEAVLGAGPHAGDLGEGGMTGVKVVAALPLPVAKWVRDMVVVCDLRRVLTVEAAGLVATVAALWDPAGLGLYHDFDQVVSTARRLRS